MSNVNKFIRGGFCDVNPKIMKMVLHLAKIIDESKVITEDEKCILGMDIESILVSYHTPDEHFKHIETILLATGIDIEEMRKPFKEPTK